MDLPFSLSFHLSKRPLLFFLTQVSICHTPASEHWPEAAEEGGPCSGVLTCTCGSSPQATPRYFSTWLLLLKSACTYFPVSWDLQRYQHCQPVPHGQGWLASFMEKTAVRDPLTVLPPAPPTCAHENSDFCSSLLLRRRFCPVPCEDQFLLVSLLSWLRAHSLVSSNVPFQQSHSFFYICGLAGKEAACNAGDLGSIAGLGRSPGEGKGYALQYSWVSLVA